MCCLQPCALALCSDMFKANSVSLAQLAGLPNARRILLNHILLDYPATVHDMLPGVNTIKSASNVDGTPDTITVSKTGTGSSWVPMHTEHSTLGPYSPCTTQYALACA